MERINIACIGRRDVITQNKAKIALEREKKEMERINIARVDHIASGSAIFIDSDTFNVSDEDKKHATDPLYQLKSRYVFKGCEIRIPAEILKNKNLNALMVRMNISPTEISALLETIISECGGDPSNIHLSYNYSYRSREEAVREVATDIKENFKVDFPLGLHWDGKIMVDIDDSNTKVERLPVHVSDSKGGTKLLGVPKLMVGDAPGLAGTNIANATYDLLKKWELEEKIATMNFDTTSTNTGHISGGCICIQKIIGRPLLWNACRKHVGEVHISKAWDILNVETSSGPEIGIFNRFKNNFNLIPLATSKKQLFDINSVESKHKVFFSDQRLFVISTLKEVQKKGAYKRDDYKELINLVLMYLGENENYEIHKPGATHKARWLMKLLHTLKIVMLEKSLPNMIFGRSKRMSVQIKRFVLFLVFCYVPWWFTCPIATSAARNDILFYQTMCNFQDIDNEISKAVKTSIQHHQWYIVSEMIPLALFDKGLDNSDKDKLAKKIMCYPRKECFESRHGQGFGKPIFQKNVPINIVDAVYSADVWNFFEILKIPTDFLKSPPQTWNTNKSYLDSLEKVSNLKVCNDVAERGVKLIQDFISQKKDEEKVQNTLQVVEDDRSVRPNLRKRANKQDTN